MNEYLKKVGIELRVARIRKGLSCREVGELCKLNPQTINKMENGADALISSYKRATDALGVSLKDIL